MAWKNPEHMVSGVKAALASPKTPSILKPHLAKRLKAAGKTKLASASPGAQPNGTPAAVEQSQYTVPTFQMFNPLRRNQ